MSVEIFGTTSGTEVDWNFYVDGSVYSESITKTMSYDEVLGKYKSTNIYPDNIYPEIFFAPSSITWNNTPINMNVRRNNYQIFHFENPFTIPSGSNSSFFIEINAVPSSTVNSADLNVYLVEKDKTIDFFSGSDWRSQSGVALVGTLGKDATYHHTHSQLNSSHHLISLMTDENGKISVDPLNPIDVNGDFWIVLYSNSPNTARGWNLKYHSQSICTNTNRWYTGSQSGWSVTTQSGCPDSHVHVARRGENPDGIKTITTAYYAGSAPEVEETLFSFEPLPNLAPNPTSFTTPAGGGTYDGGTAVTKEIGIAWNRATDSNNDDLTYKIYYSSNGTDYSLIDTTDNLILTWDITSVSNGSYTLKGEVCEKTTDDLYCTNFYLPEYFTIEKTTPIYSLTGDIKISSNNSLTNLAKAGDTVTLTFSSTGDISSSPSFSFYSGGSEISNSVDYSNEGNDWTVSFVVNENDTDGIIDFIIGAGNLDLNYSETTDSSYVTIDVTNPDDPTANPTAGSYDSSQNISITSDGSSLIKYTTDGSSPSCSTGTTYSQEITISSPTTIKAIACDEVGNYSSVSTFTYEFEYTLTYLAGSGGYISGSTPQTITQGEDASEVTAIANSGYQFLKWSDEITTASRTDTNIQDNLEVTATFQETENNEDNDSECSKSKPRGTPNIYKTISDKNSITIFFTSIENLDKYYLDYSTRESADEFRIKFGPNPADNQEYKINNLNPGTTYYFRVKGKNGCRDGIWSAVKSATTLTEHTPSFFYRGNYIDITNLSIENAKPNKCSHTISSGDTLWKISKEVYGNGSFYQLIIDNNIDKYPNILNNLTIGWELTFPCEIEEENENSYEDKTKEINNYDILIKLLNGDDPLEGAKVQIFSNPREGTTDKNGEVIFKNVEKGEHNLKISYKNFITEQRLAVGGEEKEINVSIELDLKESKNTLEKIIPILLVTIGIVSFFIYVRKNSKHLK